MDKLRGNSMDKKPSTKRPQENSTNIKRISKITKIQLTTSAGDSLYLNILKCSKV